MGRKLIKDPLYAIVYSSFLIFVIFPVVYTLGTTFFGDDSFIENVSQLNGNTFLLLGKSCVTAFLVAGLSTFAGTILGFLLFKTKVLFRGFFKISLLIPLFISPYILAVAWKDFLYLLFNNSNFIASELGVIFVHTVIFTPLSMLIVGSAFSSINAQLEESGFMITTFRSVVSKILLPLIKPALLTSFVLVFIFSISEFSVPAFFGVKVFTTEIFTQFSAFYNHSLAVLQSFILILVCILLLFAERKYITEAPFFSVGSKGTENKKYTIAKSSLALSFLFGYLFISVVLPFFILIIQSFKNGTDKFLQAFELLIPTFGNSFILALSGALIITFISFVAAYYSVEQEGRISKSFDWLLLIIFAVPSVILGVSFIKFYNMPVLDFIYSSSAVLIIAYVGKFTFISTKIIGNAVKQIPDSLSEAAQIIGIPFFSRLKKILIPLIMPALVIAFVINFIFILGELGTTIMLYPPGTEIMPIKVYTIMANAPQALTSSMTLIVFLVSLLLIGSFMLFVKHFKSDAL